MFFIVSMHVAIFFTLFIYYFYLQILSVKRDRGLLGDYSQSQDGSG